MMRESELSVCSNCEKEIVGSQSNCIYCKEKKIENARRMLLKISTAIMISIVGPASAWSAMQEQGLMLYILFYMVSKSLASKIAARSTFVAIKSYRYAPLLLLFSGLLSFAPGGVVNYTVILPILLGAYEGAYWAVYFDYKPWIDNIPINNTSKIRTATSPIGIESPIESSYQAAKLISGSFAIYQFILINSMRFVALQRGVLWLGIFVVLAELTSHLIVIFYRRITEKKSNIIKIQRQLWIIGQVAVFVGITLMITGYVLEIFSIFLFGWLFSRGSERGCLRKIEIQWSQNHLQGKQLKNERNLELEQFQNNEVIAACLGVGIATWLKIQQDYNLDPAIIGGLFAVIAWLLKFPRFIFQIDNAEDILQIGLRERIKFNSHLYVVLIFILPAMFLSTSLLVLVALLFGFFTSFLAVVFADSPKALPK